jgi:hypothetical protein
VCGNLFYWGGHGQTEHMMCAGARGYTCWNAVTCNGVDAAHRLCAAILAEIEALEGFGATFLGKVRSKARAQQRASAGELNKVERKLKGLRQKIERVKGMILAEAKGSRTLAQMITDLEADEDHLLQQRDLLSRRQQKCPLQIPSLDRIKDTARQLINGLTARTEFCQQMRELVPYLKVFPYRLMDGGRLVLRAKVVLNLVSLLPEPLRVPELSEVLRRKMTVNLFDLPQREEFRSKVVSLRQDKTTEHETAKALGITITAAQRAMALQRLMDERAAIDPYVLVTAPPEGSTKLRRHQHPRYQFQPLPGHPDW